MVFFGFMLGARCACLCIIIAGKAGGPQPMYGSGNGDVLALRSALLLLFSNAQGRCGQTPVMPDKCPPKPEPWKWEGRHGLSEYADNRPRRRDRRRRSDRPDAGRRV